MATPPANDELPALVNGTIVPVIAAYAGCVAIAHAPTPATVAVTTAAMNRRFLTFRCLITHSS